jgi:hypothetical protein
VITTYQIGTSNLNKYKPLFQNKSIQTFNPKASNSILALSMLRENSAFYDVSDDGDTIELSSQGVEKSKSFINNQSDVETKNSNETTNAKETAKVNETTQTTVETESSTEEPTDLTSYTAYELSQLLAKGTITSTEYFAEIARRDEINKLNMA